MLIMVAIRKGIDSVMGICASMMDGGGIAGQIECILLSK